MRHSRRSSFGLHQGLASDQWRSTTTGAQQRQHAPKSSMAFSSISGHAITRASSNAAANAMQQSSSAKAKENTITQQHNHTCMLSPAIRKRSLRALYAGVTGPLLTTGNDRLANGKAKTTVEAMIVRVLPLAAKAKGRSKGRLAKCRGLMSMKANSQISDATMAEITINRRSLVLILPARSLKWSIANQWMIRRGSNLRN